MGPVDGPFDHERLNSLITVVLMSQLNYATLQHRLSCRAAFGMFCCSRMGLNQTFFLLAGWAYHASPCYVYFLQPIIGLSTSSGTLLCIAADVLAAIFLQAIISRACKQRSLDPALGQDVPSYSAMRAHRIRGQDVLLAKHLDSASPQERTSFSPPEGGSSDSPLSGIAGIIYLLNPYTIAACIGGSTGSIDNCAVLLALYGSVKGQCKSSLPFQCAFLVKRMLKERTSISCNFHSTSPCFPSCPSLCFVSGIV